VTGIENTDIHHFKFYESISIRVSKILLKLRCTMYYPEFSDFTYLHFTVQVFKINLSD